ncbi:DUF2120 domain-containing protein [Methanococcus aeolicus]|uniref:DUF2120 domain-containing protein n=1 Tax=Methanococcus aeolicus (strain ATCC BAA-1280 / DSM 17508 / OCM 812 / Nankai-3) TaxID=419665 RepID=A6UVS5_META3|nr:DUF2120 domain-containing protein [Methanococcus aeolicus]ABR56597.1 conserved hypothetical protein [Methanococcus aeolicus Nankai-3]UXM84604.1 DUF2120 domain-containing protein [Methanococcus aeolicus]
MMINVTTGRIIKSLEAFKGSKPIYEKNGLLIVRSVCRDKKFEEFDSIKEYLKSKLVENKLELPDDEDINIFIEKIDEKIGEGSDIYPDAFGFEMLKKSFENMGCECDYIIGKKGELFVGICLWYDKVVKKPIFVEVICC